MDPLSADDLLKMLGDRDVTIEQLRRLVMKLEAAATQPKP
jgi:hypothetical protein